MTAVEEYLEELTESDSVEEVWGLHTKKMAEYGFDRLLYGFTRYCTSESFGDPKDFLILTNHSSDYIDPFLGENMYACAPMVRWSIENEGACSWSWIDEKQKNGELSPTELKVCEFNRSMGVVAGYSISFKSVSQRTKGAIALTARAGLSQIETDEIWKRHGNEIILINNVAHLKIITFPYSGQRPDMTKRQRQVLEWVGDGKTTQDIACILELTPATVEKHLRLARLALDVETTAQAVLKASFQNQIFRFDV